MSEIRKTPGAADWKLKPEEGDLLQALFCELHAHPELSGREYDTTDRLRKVLETIPGLQVKSLGLETGLYALLEGEGPGPTVALRSDIDALPVTEQTGLAWSSKREGVMHACGHDFHMCAVMGAAFLLAERRAHIQGRILFLFQPAEESTQGAKQVIGTGLFEREHIDRIFGLHVEPGFPKGRIGLKKGAFSASVDGFRCRVKGRGGHGAHPDWCLDPIPAAMRLVQAIYEIRARYLNPTHPAVISVTQFQAGSSYNIVPDEAVIGGTVRTMDKADRELILNRVGQAAKALEAEGYETRVEWNEGCASSDNHPALVDTLEKTAKELGLITFPYVMDMAGEDFAQYQELIPGAMFQVGVGEEVSSLHSPTFRADPSLIEECAMLLAAAAVGGCTP